MTKLKKIKGIRARNPFCVILLVNNPATDRKVNFVLDIRANPFALFLHKEAENFHYTFVYSLSLEEAKGIDNAPFLLYLKIDPQSKHFLGMQSTLSS